MKEIGPNPQNADALQHLATTMLNKITAIEAWFRDQWQKTPAPITSSVDLRNAGFKLSPVDTNLFPAGFNNLNPDFLSLCIQAVQATMYDSLPKCRRILLLPENHTRNKFYFQSLRILQDIFIQAGFDVRIGNLDLAATKNRTVQLDHGHLEIEPIARHGHRLVLKNFDPCLLLLNNDLSSGIPGILQDLHQPIQPSVQLGWASRLKSQHFLIFEQVVNEFSMLIGIDPWLIAPYSQAVTDLDFMAAEGIINLSAEVARLLDKIRHKYTAYGIAHPPFVAIKADNGTYGMGVMMVRDAAELHQLNRKQRTNMAASKGGNKVDKVIIQEGVYTFETTGDGFAAEPVVYMIGQFVVGGFYRVHEDRGVDENLNSPGMHFEPLAFANSCNIPCASHNQPYQPNRFYTYGVIARLAALAAAREIKEEI